MSCYRVVPLLSFLFFSFNFSLCVWTGVFYVYILPCIHVLIPGRVPLGERVTAAPIKSVIASLQCLVVIVSCHASRVD